MTLLERRGPIRSESNFVIRLSTPSLHLPTLSSLLFGLILLSKCHPFILLLHLVLFCNLLFCPGFYLLKPIAFPLTVLYHHYYATALPIKIGFLDSCSISSSFVARLQGSRFVIYHCCTGRHYSTKTKTAWSRLLGRLTSTEPSLPSSTE